MFSVVPPSSLPGPATFDEAPAFSSDTYYLMEPRALRAQLLARLKALRAQSDTR